MSWINQFLKLPRLLLADWPVKLGAIAVAFILFLYVQFAQNVTKVVHIRVTSPEIPLGLGLSSRIPSFLDVKLYGPSELMDITKTEFRMNLLNQRPVRGENVYRVTLTPDLPAGIEASYARELKVVLDEILYRELPIEPVFDAQRPAPGGIRIRPRTVLVRGPYQRLAEMDRVLTVPVTGEHAIQSVKVILAEMPDFVSLADGQPNEVSLEIWDREGRPGEKVIEGITVKCVNQIQGLKLRNPPVVRIRAAVPDGRADQFRATVVCPLFLDTRTRTIHPSYFIPGMNIEVEDLLGRVDRTVLLDGTSIPTLQFEKLENQIPIPMQQGQQDHIFR
ncbi:MAG: hypothetical protein JNM27_06925 [Leptospirales bacterium]|nr:hypothetical protein [Leptospirales bacterium]